MSDTIGADLVHQIASGLERFAEKHQMTLEQLKDLHLIGAYLGSWSPILASTDFSSRRRPIVVKQLAVDVNSTGARAALLYS